VVSLSVTAALALAACSGGGSEPPAPPAQTTAAQTPAAGTSAAPSTPDPGPVTETTPAEDAAPVSTEISFDTSGLTVTETAVGTSAPVILFDPDWAEILIEEGVSWYWWTVFIDNPGDVAVATKIEIRFTDESGADYGDALAAAADPRGYPYTREVVLQPGANALVGRYGDLADDRPPTLGAVADVTFGGGTQWERNNIPHSQAGPITLSDVAWDSVQQGEDPITVITGTVHSLSPIGVGQDMSGIAGNLAIMAVLRDAGGQIVGVSTSLAADAEEFRAWAQNSEGKSTPVGVTFGPDGTAPFVAGSATNTDHMGSTIEAYPIITLG
jgi:hypothetical protein